MAGTAGDIDCLSLVNKTNSYCLNESSSHPHSKLFAFDGAIGPDSFLESDSDEQLLLSLTFNSTVKISSIQFATLTDGTAPCIIKMFINRTSMGFSDAEDNKPVHTIQLKSGIEAQKILLPAYRFNAVDTLVLFIESNCSDGESDVTILKGLNIFGQALSGTDVSQIKKQG